MPAKDCPPGKERSIKSGNCVKKCNADQERNVKTGRCIKRKGAETKKNLKASSSSPFSLPRAPAYVSPSFLSSSSSSLLAPPPLPLKSPSLPQAFPSPKEKILTPIQSEEIDVPIPKNKIVIDAAIRKYLNNSMNLDNDNDMKDYIDATLRTFKRDVLSNTNDVFYSYLTDNMGMDEEAIYAITVEDFLKSLEDASSPFQSDYVIIRKYKMHTVRKLLDRVKFSAMIDNGVFVELGSDLTLEELFKKLTTDFNMTVSPGMANYLKNMIRSNNNANDSNESGYSYRSDAEPEYNSADKYSEESYGMVGSPNRNPGQDNGRRKGNRGVQSTSSSW